MADSTLLGKIFNSVLARICIAALQTVLGSLVLLLTFLVRQYIDILILKYTLVLAVGLLAGFSARRFLTTQTQILKLLTAWISAALSLAILYILSGGFLGINLFFGFNKTPDWQGLIQLALAAVGALLVITAFRTSPTVETTPTPAPGRRPKKSTLKPKPALIQWPLKLNFSTAKKTNQKSIRSSANKKSAPSLAIQKTPKKGSSLQKVSVASAPIPKIKKPARAKKKTVRKKRVKRKAAKEIKFVGDIEHRCPYCLEIVEPHDPRGVKICPICKTHHHKDCWGITGACQIPHSNNKS
jgi:hypothetical protein